MNKQRQDGCRVFRLSSLAVLLIALVVIDRAGAQTAANELFTKCVGCHAPKGGALDVVTAQRKTPEGWEMTLIRMVRTHGAQLQPAEVGALVKYLSDAYGLAPSEVEPFRYMLEKRNTKVVQHEVPQFVQASCMQCHSYERTILQRRTLESWSHIPDMKLALFTNTENVTASSGLLQDFWYDEVKKKVLPHLAKQFPFSTAAWTKWQAKAKTDYAGNWKIVGHDAGKGGDYTGQVTLKALGEDKYGGEFVLDFSDGSKVSGKTTGLIYTGFQWRGSVQLEGGKIQREIFFASEDGATLQGRRVLAPVGDLGMDETWYRSGGSARLFSVIPTTLQAGEKQTVKIFGANLPANLTTAAVSFGNGVTITSLNQTGDDTIVAEVVAAKGAAVGLRQLRFQGVTGTLPFYVYRNIDYIRLLPETAFARPGGDHIPKYMQQFEAFAYLKGPDGEKGTKDDVKLHRVRPEKWNLEEYVKRLNDDDMHFVGAVDENGLFTPAQAGPNPQRHMMDHNIGDVWVEAWYKPRGAKQPMGARAYLLVMPEKFSFQPIE
ncbi:MAG: quinohemoprotein amine dehydrogenase subunit alpha [Deltaproteobacteria bacterium]|nr:quinohemoprotein amine dehydrogenase subunit alpha [Deltaproteobacteria bacterium]